MASGNNGNGRPQESALGVSSDSESVPTDEVSRRDEMVALKIIPIKDSLRDIAAITQLLNSLAGFVTPLSLELVGIHLQRFLIVRCPTDKISLVKAQIVSIYGNPTIEIFDPDKDPIRIFDSSDFTGTAQLTLGRSEGLPIRTYRELETNDPLLPILGALYDLEDNEFCASQLVVRAKAPEDWAANYKKELLSIKRRQAGMLSMGQLARLMAFIGGIGIVLIGTLMALFGDWEITAIAALVGIPLVIVGFKFFKGSDLEWSEAHEEMVTRKIQMPGYIVELRLASASPSRKRAWALLEGLAGAYNLFTLEAGNKLELLRGSTSQRFHPENLHDESAAMILGDEEIATLWHLPVADMPDMLEVERVQHTLPDKNQVRNHDGWYVGEAQKSAGDPIQVFLPRSAISGSHTLVLGRTRMGKSTLMERMIVELAKDPERSLIVMDPHDDMVVRLLGLIPEDRLSDVEYYDFADDDFIPGLNPVDVGLFDGDPERTKEAFKEVAHSLFKRYWGPRMEVVFEKSAAAICLANSIREPASQFTILGMLDLLTMNSDSRMSFLRHVLPDPDDNMMSKIVLEYFQFEFDGLQKAFREQVIMPVLSKLRAFESTEALLRIFGQPQSTFNIMRAVQEGKIILVRTGEAKLSAEFSGFVGSLLLNMAHRAILAQGRISPEERRQVTIFVDETQAFSGVDFGEVLAKIGKFGGNIILTTQGEHFIGRSTASDQIDDPNVFNKILDNVDNLVVYRMSGRAADSFADTEFWNEATPADLINLQKHQAFIRYAQEKRVVGPFKVNMAPPLETDSLIAAQIMSMRANYSTPADNALDIARRSRSRTSAHFHTENAAIAGVTAGGEMIIGAPGSSLEELVHSVNLDDLNLSDQLSNIDTA